MTLDIRPYYSGSGVRITGIPGRGDTLVVSFTGIGKPDRKEQDEEFVRQGSQGGENHVLFVSDTARSWFNNAGVVEQITGFVQSYKVEHTITRVATFGNSMGGYGAIQFAGALGASSCLAISAQYSANPADVPEETRWRNWRDRIETFSMPPLGRAISPDTEYYILHGEAEKERPHFERFPRGKGIHHYLLPDVGHAVGRRLKETRLLRKTVRLALERRPRQFRKLMEGLGASRRT